MANEAELGLSANTENGASNYTLNRGNRGCGKTEGATSGSHQMLFCKLDVGNKSETGIESIFQSKVDSLLNSVSVSKDKEGVCYFLKPRLPKIPGTVDWKKVMVLRDAGIVVSSLVSDDQLLGKDSCVTLLGKTTQRYP